MPELHIQQERREGYAQVTHEFVERMIEHVTQEETFWRNFKVFAGGYTVLFSFILCIIGWILIEKNGDIKEMQHTLNLHTQQIERTLAIVEQQVDVNKTQQARIERNTEILMQRR